MKAILETKNLSRSFGGLKAVSDVSFSVVPGIIQGIIGPNGAGKSTLFNLIAGRLDADEGEVYFDGTEITKLPQYKIASLGISSTFQTSRLFPELTVLENVKVGRHCKSKAGFFASLFNLPKTWKEEKDIEQYSLNILEELDLTDLIHEEAANLAFGKMRLVEIARALATEPKLLLLDEPAAGLNMAETDELASLIFEIKKKGITVLLVEHDMSLVMSITDEIVVLNQGAKLTEGKPDDIQKNPEVIKVYLGDDDA